MQLSKISLVICALALGAAVSLRAEDNPAQAAARAALAKKLFELNAQQPQLPATNAIETKKVAAAKPASVVQPTTQVKSEPVMKPIGAEAKAKAKAQAAAELKAKRDAKKQAEADQAAAAKADKAKAKADKKTAAELKAKQAAEKKTVTAETANAKLTTTAAPMELPANPAADTPAQAAARAALAKKLFELNAQQPQTPPPQPVETKKVVAAKPVPAEDAKLKAQKAAVQQATKKSSVTKPAVATETAGAPKAVVVSYPGKELGLQPIAGPASPIAPAKEAKLQALLEKYKADQLTPEEYHQQRAAILAEP